MLYIKNNHVINDLLYEDQELKHGSIYQFMLGFTKEGILLYQMG